MILFENLDPDATTFAVIDTLLYLFQAFISAHIIYRLLPILTKDQADQSLPKTFLTLALTGVGALMLYKYLSPAGLMILHPPLVGIIMVLILKYLMWMSYLRCVIVTLFSAVLFTLFFFLNTRVVNSFLPAERNTLLKQFGTAIELMEEVEVGKDEKFIDKEQLAIMARNLKLQKEAWEFAFMIMENPNYINEITAQHQSRLALLGLLAEEGEMPSAEQLAELGIVYKDPGMAVEFRKMWTDVDMNPQELLKDGVSLEEMNMMVGMLKNLSGEEEEVSTLDAAVMFQSLVTKELMTKSGEPTEQHESDLNSLSPLSKDHEFGPDKLNELGLGSLGAEETESYIGILKRLKESADKEQEAVVTLKDLSTVMDVLEDVRGKEVEVTPEDSAIVMQGLMAQSVANRNVSYTTRHEAELRVLGEVLEGKKHTPEQLTDLWVEEIDPLKTRNLKNLFQRLALDYEEIVVLPIQPDDLTVIQEFLMEFRGETEMNISQNDAAMTLQSLINIFLMGQQGLAPEEASSIIVDALEGFDFFYVNGFRKHPPPLTALHLALMGIVPAQGENGMTLNMNPATFHSNVIDPYLRANPAVATIIGEAQALGSRIGTERGDPSDPFRNLNRAQKRAWLSSMKLLEVNAVIKNAKGRTFAIVNNTTLSMGSAITVEFEGTKYRWRMAGVDGQNVIWEPIIKEEGMLIVF